MIPSYQMESREQEMHTLREVLHPCGSFERNVIVHRYMSVRVGVRLRVCEYTYTCALCVHKCTSVIISQRA